MVNGLMLSLVVWFRSVFSSVYKALHTKLRCNLQANTGAATRDQSNLVFEDGWLEWR